MIKFLKSHRLAIVTFLLALMLVFWVNESEVVAITLRLFTPRPPSCSAPPISPTNLTVRRVSLDRVDLSWTDNSNNEFGFEIWRSLDSVRWNDLTTRVNIDVVEYSDLDAKLNYFYNVRAWNDCGTTQSNIYRVFISNPTPIPSPIFTQTPSPFSTPVIKLTQQTLPTETATSVVTVMSSENSENEIPVIIAQANLQIRNGPASDFAEVGVLYEDTSSEILGISSNSQWIKIVCPRDAAGVDCWIRLDNASARISGLNNIPTIVPTSIFTTALSEPPQVTPTDVTPNGDATSKTSSYAQYLSLMLISVVIIVIVFIGYRLLKK